MKQSKSKSNQIKSNQSPESLKAVSTAHIQCFPMLFIYLTGRFTLFADMRRLRQSGTEIPSILAWEVEQSCRMWRSIGLYWVHTGVVALQVPSSAPPAVSFLLSEGSSRSLSLRRAVVVCRAPQFSGALGRNSVATGEKLSRGPRCCLVQSVICPVSRGGWGLPNSSTPGAMQICFKSGHSELGVAEREWYLFLMQNNSLESYLWGGGKMARRIREVQTKHSMF